MLSFAAKTGLKEITAVPRPYTHELQKLALLESPDEFYSLSQGEKDQVIAESMTEISPGRTQHWLGETNYSFPSGHMIFAAVCVLFWGGFFLRRRLYWPLLPLLLWGVGVGISRVWLGMHWPSDLLMSIFSAGVLYLLIPQWQERKQPAGVGLQITQQ